MTPIVTARNAFVVVPSDSQLLPGGTTAGLWIGGAGSGNLTVTLLGGATVKFTSIGAGTFLPIITTQVWATGTDVTAMIGLMA